MSNKSILALCFVMLLSCLMYAKLKPVEVKAPNGFHVHNLNTGLNYATIQEVINANQTENGHTILVDAGTYYEHVLVNKSITLIGENKANTLIDGNQAGIPIHITVPNVTIKEFTIKNGVIGISLEHSNNSVIMENDVIDNVDAVQIRYSNNFTIDRNIIANNTGRGVLITSSRNFKVSHNYVSHNGWATHSYGINANASSRGVITQNQVYDNYFDGIGLLDSRNCTISENDVKNNLFMGIWLDSSNGNMIYHNNIINNRGKQATAAGSTSIWDDGYPSGGNYWSNYTGVDVNRDGIGDTAYFVDINNNTDRYPLMGMFTAFNASLGYNVNIVSNSTVNSFNYFEDNRTIRMSVSNASSNQSFGFCRVCIPKSLMPPPYTVTIDNGATALLHFNGTLYDNVTHRWIYFVYPHSIREIVIIPEFPRAIMLSLFMFGLLLPAMIHKRKCPR